MYICEECGTVFTYPNAVEWKENHGDGIVEPCAMGVCPECGSDMWVTAYQCDNCGEWFHCLDIFGGYCCPCIEKLSTKDTLLEYVENKCLDDYADALREILKREKGK